MEKYTQAEKLYRIYKEERTPANYALLYNMGIFLHVCAGSEWIKADFFDPQTNKRIIPLYDKVDGVMTFTKIGIY